VTSTVDATPAQWPSEPRPEKPAADADAVRRARRVLAVYADGTPRETRGQRLYDAWQLARSLGADAEHELMHARFDAGQEQRRSELLGRLLVPVPAGELLMGGDPPTGYAYYGEAPAHRVRLRTFTIASVPVTNGMYRAYDPTRSLGEPDDLPVVDVTWYDAVMFCRWLGLRLPTEAEWEYACRGFDGDPEPGELASYAWHAENAGGRLHEVGRLAPNALGVRDLQGNVWEWCQDRYDPEFYARSPALDPVNDDVGTDRVCRGGSFHGFADMCRSTLRYHEPPDYWAPDIGFRCAGDIDPQ